ncbi:MAG: class E sortase [Actinomycetaceae bacterium]|nr:class E sortase [Actinomycetaceae bacterium]
MFDEWADVEPEAPTSTLAAAAGFGMSSSAPRTQRLATEQWPTGQQLSAGQQRYPGDARSGVGVGVSHAGAGAATGAAHANGAYYGQRSGGQQPQYNAAVAGGTRTAAVKAKKPSLVSRLAGLLGELLITAGAFIGLFIVWQVWWTDIIANRAQEEQITAITQDWGGHEEQQSESAPPVGQPHTEEPPTMAHSTATGNVEGIMRIPAFGVDYKHTIQYGTSLKTVLDKGAFGHYEGTAYPGEVGNYALAAHRQTYGAPMKNVDKLKVDDSIIIETSEAYYVYKVKSSYTVTPDAIEVVAPVPNKPGQEPTQRLLTITTCHPPFISDKRWVVHAEFDHWVARSEGVPEELVQK